MKIIIDLVGGDDRVYFSDSKPGQQIIIFDEAMVTCITSVQINSCTNPHPEDWFPDYWDFYIYCGGCSILLTFKTKAGAEFARLQILDKSKLNMD